MKTKICIIGCGTYGAYLIKRLSEQFGQTVEITVVEMGNETIKNESEIGIEAESGVARAAQQGRYFGLGGTSARWGGQVLFFDERDNPTGDKDWQTIVEINNRYRRQVLQNILGNVPKIDALMNDTGDEKTGVWLKYTKRNLFKALDKNLLTTVNIIKNQRVTDFIFDESKITAAICQNTEGSQTTIEADVFYLTTGAIESCRLLLDIKEKHPVTMSTDLGKHYGDHISVELFKINQRPVIGKTDFLPRLLKGSLVTKRWIVADKNGQIGFAHPVFNSEVHVFTSIKRMLFGKQKVDFKLKDILEGAEFLVRFGFNILFLKKMYAHRNEWILRLEMEQAFPNKNTISLSENIDRFGQKAAKLNWQVSEEDRRAIEEVKADLMQKLDAQNVAYSVIYDPNIGSTKIEDVYHPAGFMRLGHDENAVLDTDCRVKGIDNLYHFSTAMFPSAKSINPTAAGFCFIEHHLSELKNDGKNDGKNVRETLKVSLT